MADRGDYQAVSTHSHPKVAACLSSPSFAITHVSTHSHPKVAAFLQLRYAPISACFNTQPPEGGCLQPHGVVNIAAVSTHSHPKVAAYAATATPPPAAFQHTATRRWLRPCVIDQGRFFMFQHTATRRWLPARFEIAPLDLIVSTHSHPKVAANWRAPFAGCRCGFNTQPPEGGCVDGQFAYNGVALFQHTATRRWLRPPTGGI